MSTDPTPTEPTLIGVDLFDSREFLDSLAEGVMLIGLDGIIIDCNVTALRLLGVTRSSMQGRHLSDPLWGAVGEDGAAIAMEDLPASVTLRTGEPVVDVIIGFDIPGDGRRWMSTNSSIIGTRQEMKGVTNTFLDVTYLMAEKRAQRTFMELAKTTLSSGNQRTLFAELCGDIITLGGYALAWVGAAAAGPSPFEVLAAAGDVSFLSEGVSPLGGEGPNGGELAKSALESGTVMVTTDLARAVGDARWRVLARERGYGAAIAIPLQVVGAEPAVLVIFGREAGAFDVPSQDLLSQMTAAFSLSLTRLRDSEELARAYEGTLVALGTMVETRDPYTAGHQLNVGRLGMAIALQMGLDHASAVLIRQAGEVHDVGKYAVPAEILARTGKLDPLEFELIQRHPLAGSQVLSAAKLHWPLGDTALQHHERLDGSGYPAGLKGEEICFPARVIAVADVVEAMSHLRPYRAALGTEAALAEIRAGSGTLFDAAVVEACCAVFADGFVF